MDTVFYLTYGFSSLMTFLAFALVIGLLILVIVKRAKTWKQNYHSPRLTVTAKIVAKRMDVSSHIRADIPRRVSSTAYYVTFEVEGGERLELCVEGPELSLIHI